MEPWRACALTEGASSYSPPANYCQVWTHVDLVLAELLIFQEKHKIFMWNPTILKCRFNFLNIVRAKQITFENQTELWTTILQPPFWVASDLHHDILCPLCSCLSPNAELPTAYLADSYSSFNTQLKGHLDYISFSILFTTFHLSTKKGEKNQTQGQGIDMWKKVHQGGRHGEVIKQAFPQRKN